MKDEIHPTAAELQEARRHTKKALEKSRNRLQNDEELTLCLGWIENESVLGNMDGAAGRAFGSMTIRVQFNTDPDLDTQQEERVNSRRDLKNAEEFSEGLGVQIVFYGLDVIIEFLQPDATRRRLITFRYHIH